jgi:hypothetical protein
MKAGKMLRQTRSQIEQKQKRGKDTEKKKGKETLNDIERFEKA